MKVTETRSVVVEREMTHPPEKLWRALTQPHLIAEGLMKDYFSPWGGSRFNRRGEWVGVLDCEVLVVEPDKELAYTWNHAHDDPAFNLQSVVTFTLTPTATGTLLRIEQAGLPARSAAGVRRRQCRMTTDVPEARTGRGDRVTQEVELNWNGLIRQTHRWLSIAFTLAVIFNLICLIKTEQVVWVVLLALFPLILLLLSGLYLFALPYMAKGRS